jgi:hypothetical protein
MTTKPLSNFSRPFLIVVFMIIISIACTLTADPSDTSDKAPTATKAIEPTPTLYDNIQASGGGANPPLGIPNNVTSDVPQSSNLANQIIQVDGNRVMNSIVNLVRYENRHTLSEPSQVRGIQAARDYLLSEFYGIQAANPDIRIDVSRHQYEFRYRGQPILADNVMMVINGTDQAAGIILVGAHYDTISNASFTDYRSYQPGANDNGSGVAAVMELARILAQKPHRATIVFVLFSGEELGRYGSQAYMNEYILRNNIPLKAVINLDIIGSPTGANGERYDNQMRVYSASPNNSPSRQLARLIEFVGRYFVPDMIVNLEDGIDRTGRWSDHQTFSDAGFPAIRLIEQSDEVNRAHTARDTLDDIESDYIRKTTQVALATVIVLADGPDAPAEVRLDPATWRLEWLPSRGATHYVVAFRQPGSLVFDLQMVVDVTGLNWVDMPRYEAVAIAAVNGDGQIGPFSTEVAIPR